LSSSNISNMCIKVKGISHITLICKNLDKTTKFLQELFAAKEIYTSGTKNFSRSKEKFFLINKLWVAIMEGKSIERTYNHIAFAIDAKALKLAKQKIRKLKLTLLPDRTRQKGEGKSLYFYDYDNHLFELQGGYLKTRLKLYNKNKT